MCLIWVGIRFWVWATFFLLAMMSVLPNKPRLSSITNTPGNWILLFMDSSMLEARGSLARSKAFFQGSRRLGLVLWKIERCLIKLGLEAMLDELLDFLKIGQRPLSGHFEIYFWKWIWEIILAKISKESGQFSGLIFANLKNVSMNWWTFFAFEILENLSNSKARWSLMLEI